MRYIRKIVEVLTVIAILASIPVRSSAASTNKTIYQTSTVENITSGATLERIKRFTQEGWQSINVIRVDLSNPNIEVDTLTDKESIRKAASTLNHAKNNGAIAAINGGFFLWTDESGIVSPIGPAVRSGNVLSASYDFNREKETMATFSIDNTDNAGISYWKTDIKLITADGKAIPVGRYNQPYYGHQDLTIIDRRWSKTSIGTDTKYGSSDIIEMIVENDTVKEIRKVKPSVEIPANGYVVVTRNSGTKLIEDNFKVGDKVRLDITATVDLDQQKMAMTGGSILVKDGVIPQQFSHSPSDMNVRNPRTAIGSSRDGKQVIMVTVDGRQQGSIGMTQAELAQLMLELGAYNALNLDGGGSTTMVARPQGETSVQVINTPSEGSQRSVASAIGVFSIAPPSELAGLIIQTVDKNVFVNTSREFYVKGFDKYLNPVEVDPEQVKWSVTGVQGTFKGNTLYPTSVGEGKVIATVGNVKAEFVFNSLSSPVELKLNEKSVYLKAGQTKAFTVTGKNKNGYYATINPLDVKWSVSGAMGIFEGNVFKALRSGSGYISASIGNTYAYCAVSVASESTVTRDRFERKNGKFVSYPDTVKGSYSISNENKYMGRLSGKLTYDFTSDLDKSRAAYLEFLNGGIALPSGISKIGLWYFSDHASPSWLAAEVTDSDGKIHRLYFTKGLEASKWKYVEVSLQDINSPAKLTRIYVVLTESVADSGVVYLDDLKFTTFKYPAIDNSKIPRDTVPVDEANKSVEYVKSANSFRFVVFGQSREPANELEKMIADTVVYKVNRFLETAAVVGNSAHSMVQGINRPYISTNTGYKSYDMPNSRFIQLDMSKKGLRLSDAEQWSWFLNQLDTAKGDNIFIFLANSPKSFSDSLEAELFQDILTRYRQEKGKNIWVFYKDKVNSSYMERGIKYITTAGYEVEGLTQEKIHEAKFVVVTVMGNQVTFEFKPVTG